MATASPSPSLVLSPGTTNGRKEFSTVDTVTGNMSSENINFVRLCKLLIGEGTHVLKDVFDSIHPPKSLRNHLFDNNVRAILQGLKKNEILSKEQWEKLYPPSRVSTVTSTTFDITLLYLLLHCICNLSSPAGASDTEPSSATVIIHLEEIKSYQKKLYADYISEPASFSDTEFDKYWDDIVNALVGLRQTNYKAEIQKTKSCSLDQDLEDESNYILVLEIWNKCDAESLMKYKAPRLGAMQQLTPKKDETQQKKRKDTDKTKKEGASIPKPSSEEASKSNQGEEASKSIHEKIEDLEFQIERLQLESDNKDQTIKELKQKIKNLEKEIKELKEGKKALQTKLDNIKADMDSKIHNLNTKNEKTEKELNNTKAEMQSQIQKLEADVRKLQEKELNLSVEDKAWLHVGQMCWVIKGLMYKLTLPNLYTNKKNYKFEQVQNDIKKLKKKNPLELYEKHSMKPADVTKAQKTLDDLQALLKLEVDHVDAMIDIQDDRNTKVAHPELEESHLREYAKVLDEKGEFKGLVLSLSIVNELIEMWKQLVETDRKQ